MYSLHRGICCGCGLLDTEKWKEMVKFVSKLVVKKCAELIQNTNQHLIAKVSECRDSI